VTTPPNPPNGDDNLYGGPPPPPGDNPPPPPNPYGATPYPGGDAYGGQAQAPKTDGISIAALVLGLSCCLSFVGIILGFVGLSRTKNGQRKGRWAAITGIVVGFLGTGVAIAVIAGGVWIFNNAVTPDNAEVGQCISIDEDGGEVTMLKKECSEKHDGEIVAVEELDSDSAKAAEDAQVGYCTELLSEEDLTAILERDDVELQAVFEDPNDVKDGDHIVCYVEATSGDLDEKVLD
jgi:hypothetical protein